MYIFEEFLAEISIKSSTVDLFCFVVLQVTKPVNGNAVELKLVVTSTATTELQLSIHTSVQAMKHEGSPATTIQTTEEEGTVQPKKGDSSSA